MHYLGSIVSDYFFGPQASGYASDHDDLFMFILWLCVFFFALIVGLAVFFTVRYRRRDGYVQKAAPIHSTKLEIAWTVLPTLILMGLFVWGFKVYSDMREGGARSEQIDITGIKWAWAAKYDNGAAATDLEPVDVRPDGVPIIPVPADRMVKLSMISSDVIHSFFIPDFRIKRDVMPGRYSEMVFRPRLADPTAPYEDHTVYCAEYCGKEHSSMLAIMRVMPEKAYDAEKIRLADWQDGLSPVEIGERLYKVKSCNTCHAVLPESDPDCPILDGPTWHGLYGATRTLIVSATGQEIQRVADDVYIRESIIEPAKEIVKGRKDAMSSYQGQITEDEIRAIIAYMKSISDNDQAGPAASQTE